MAAMTTQNIVWLASYPKSGNTWVRAFLANYLTGAAEPVSINELNRLTMIDTMVQGHEQVLGRTLDGLSDAEILAARPRLLQAIARNGADLNLVKTHNVNGVIYGVRIIPAALTRLAVYIVRNPLDMVPSYARHFAKPLDEVIGLIARDGNTAAPDRHNTRQFLSSWSRNVESWTEARGFPVLVLRYEDLLAEPETWFGKLLQALGAQPDPARLTRSIRHASFQSLQAQEAAAGFVERPDHAERFFHSGQAGGWKTELTAAQVARIRADHGPMMQRFGYF